MVLVCRNICMTLMASRTRRNCKANLAGHETATRFVGTYVLPGLEVTVFSTIVARKQSNLEEIRTMTREQIRYTLPEFRNFSNQHP